MNQQNKYKAKGTYWSYSEQREIIGKERDDYLSLSPYKRKKIEDISFFPSMFEVDVYQTLVKTFGLDNVIRQFPVSLLPRSRSYPDGKSWLIDFAVKSKLDKKSIFILVEAKGYPTDPFLMNLGLLEAVNPYLSDRLTIVFQKRISTHTAIQNRRNTNSDVEHGKVLTFNEFVSKYSHVAIE